MFRYGLLALAALISFSSRANVCENSTGVTQNINFDITENLAQRNNVAGSTFSIEKNPDTLIGVQALCPLQGITRSMRSYVTNYPIAHTDGDLKYIKLNDYLEGAISIHDDEIGTYYPPVNYKSMGYTTNIERGFPFDVADSQLNFTFRVTKPFVGNVQFNMDPVFYVYVTTSERDPLTKVVYTISYSGNITVPQSCEINAGQVISINFGSMGAGAFSQAGAGNKPAGVNEQTKNIGIKCENMSAQAMLSLRLETNNASGNALVSDNPDVGFIVANSAGQPLTPNDMSSSIPFQLDDSGAATVPVKAWPVSITGNKPAEGVFTAQGYLRVDYD